MSAKKNAKTVALFLTQSTIRLKQDFRLFEIMESFFSNEFSYRMFIRWFLFLFLFSYPIQVASMVALMIQFVVLAKQKEIMKSEEDLSGNNLFSFIFIIGIVVSFFKLIADILVIYGAVNVSNELQNAIKLII